MPQHAASSLAFLIPCVVALYMEKHVVSASMLVLVATSIANRQFGALKTLDRVLVRAITIAYANTLGNVNYVTAVALRCIGGDNICYVLQTSRSHMML